MTNRRGRERVAGGGGGSWWKMAEAVAGKSGEEGEKLKELIKRKVKMELAVFKVLTR